MNAILVFGASGAFGIGVDEEGGWVGRLRKYFEPKDKYNAVYNLGVPGDTSTLLLERFGVEAKARTRKRWPQDKYTILISIGTNDTASYEKDGPSINPVESVQENIKQLIEKAKTFTSDVLVLGLWPVDEERVQPYEKYYFYNDRIRQYHEAIRDICREKEIPFLDKFEEVINSDYKHLLLDGIHGTSEGYEKLYTYVKYWLKENNIID